MSDTVRLVRRWTSVQPRHLGVGHTADKVEKPGSLLELDVVRVR